MKGAGELQERLQFEMRAAPIDDGYGNTIAGDWTPQFQCWAKLTFLKGSETVLAARLEARQPTVIKVRRSSQAGQISHEWRARDIRTGVVYAIKERPRKTDDRAYLEMMAEAGVAA